jgi:hypothetical protein
MKQILALSLLLITFSYPLSIIAQNQRPPHFCGTSHDALELGFEKMMELRARYGDNVQMRAVAYIPLAVHAVAKSDGTGRVNEARLLDIIDNMNKTYAANGLEMQFYLKYLNLYNDDALYSAPNAFSGISKSFTQRKSDALNIYITNELGDGTISGSTQLGYYLNRASSESVLYTADWIFIKASEVVNGANATLEHEVGHFFSLPHTFRGFDDDPFRPSVANPCAPRSMNFRGTVVQTENYARTGTDANCSTAGDGFCDTQADYNLGFGWNTCNYTGIAKDPTCVSVDPDETNLMGYFPPSCTNKFSPMQKSAMMNDYSNNNARRYLRNGNITPSLINMTVPTLQLPANNSTTNAFTPISFDWTDVNGVTGGANKESGYIFEIATPFASFTANVHRILVTGSSLVLNSSNTPAGYLKANTRYHWRVRPYGTYKMGGDYTATSTFTTGSVNSVKEIEGIKDFSVSPNPTSAAQDLTISLSSDKAFTGLVKLYNIAGQLISTENRRFDIGYTTQTIDIQNFTKGVYVLTIESENGILNKKIVITD